MIFSSQASALRGSICPATFWSKTISPLPEAVAVEKLSDGSAMEVTTAEELIAVASFGVIT